MNKDQIKIKEISAGLSGVIPVASYENLRPSYNMVVELIGDVNPDEVFDYIEEILHDRFELEVNRAKTDLIERDYANIRFREKDGKKYPSVTSILEMAIGITLMIYQNSKKMWLFCQVAHWVFPGKIAHINYLWRNSETKSKLKILNLWSLMMNYSIPDGMM